FDIAVGMVRQSPYLSGRLKVVPSPKRIVDPQTGSYLRAIPADAAGSHGFNAHGVVADELPAWPHWELFGVLLTSTGARLQPLFLTISSAGLARQSIGYEVYEYACKVRDGIIQDPTFYPCIYAADDADDWTDEAVWRKANPAL